MSVNPILNFVSAALAQQSAPGSVRAPVSTPQVDTNTSTSSTDTTPSQSVLQSASLTTASANFAQLGSLLQIAQGGTQQVDAVLQQLEVLAQQASQSGDSIDLNNINNAFQQLLGQIDQTVGNTTFGGTPVLNGSLSAGANDSSDSQTSLLSLPNLTTGALFGNNPPSVSTSQDANNALTAIASAQDTTSGAANAISEVFGQLSFASASVDSAFANTTAASSTLTDSDVEGSNTSSDLSGILSNPSLAIKAQGGSLTNLLNLLQG